MVLHLKVKIENQIYFIIPTYDWVETSKSIKLIGTVPLSKTVSYQIWIKTRLRYKKAGL